MDNEYCPECGSHPEIKLRLIRDKAELQAECRRLFHRNSELTAQVSELTKKLEEQRAEIVQLRQRNQGLTQNVDRFRTDAEELTKLLAEARKVPESAYCASGVEPCACAVANNLDATRYRFLRDQDIESNFPRSGIFIGRIPNNECLTGSDADSEIDKAMLSESQNGEQTEAEYLDELERGYSNDRI